MRMLFVGGPYHGLYGHGAGMADALLADAIRAQGHEVNEIAIGNNDYKYAGMGKHFQRLTEAVRTVADIPVTWPIVASFDAATAVKNRRVWFTDHGGVGQRADARQCIGTISCVNSTELVQPATDRGIKCVVVHPPDLKLCPVPHKDNYVVVPGASKVKGIDTVLAVARMMSDVHFVVVRTWGGDTEQLAELVRLDNVALLCEPVEPFALIEMMGVCFLPTTRENWCGVTRLAAIQDVPVVTSYIHGTRNSTGAGAAYVELSSPPHAWVSALRGALRRGKAFGPVPQIDTPAEITKLCEALAQ